jgi:hypothetical protein
MVMIVVSTELVTRFEKVIQFLALEAHQAPALLIPLDDITPPHLWVIILFPCFSDLLPNSHASPARRNRPTQRP